MSSLEKVPNWLIATPLALGAFGGGVGGIQFIQHGETPGGLVGIGLLMVSVAFAYFLIKSKVGNRNLQITTLLYPIFLAGFIGVSVDRFGPPPPPFIGLMVIAFLPVPMTFFKLLKDMAPVKPEGSSEMGTSESSESSKSAVSVNMSKKNLMIGGGIIVAAVAGVAVFVATKGPTEAELKPIARPLFTQMFGGSAMVYQVSDCKDAKPGYRCYVRGGGLQSNGQEMTIEFMVRFMEDGSSWRVASFDMVK